MKEDGPMCPLPGCNQTMNERAINDLKDVVAKGFTTMQQIQAQRTENDAWTKYLLEHAKEQNNINTKLFDKFSDLLKQMGEKVDKDTLTNAMETVQKTFVQLKSDMKWFIGFSMGAATLVIALLNYFTK